MLFLLVVAIFLVSAASSLVGKEAIVQPIQFNHRIHVEGLEMACTECHKYVMETEFAGRPKLGICADCHDMSLTDSPEEVILLKFVKSGEEIPWQRLYQIPPHVYYSHRRHTTVARIECGECHGEIGLSTSPPDRPLKQMTMAFCLDCHEKRSVTTDCNQCHR